MCFVCLFVCVFCFYAYVVFVSLLMYNVPAAYTCFSGRNGKEGTMLNTSECEVKVVV